MRTARSLPSSVPGGGQGGALSRGVFLSRGGVSLSGGGGLCQVDPPVKT